MPDREGVHSCWTLADARHIDQRAKAGAKVVLVGAGFIGCTVIDALAQRGVELTIVEMADRIAAGMLNVPAAALVQRWCEERGVRVLTSSEVEEIDSGPGAPALRVRLAGGETLRASLVVLATGVRPAVDFLPGSGVEIDRGVLADEHLRTSHPDVYAAGDVAQGPNLLGGKRNVHAIQPAAVDHGRIAALNMAGRNVAFHGSLPMNLLDTMGVVSCSMGRPNGAAAGDACEVIDEQRRRYLRLAFSGERLVGAQTVGHTQFLGVLRGLIQTGVELGEWKQRLLERPERVTEAFVARTVQ